MNETWGEPGRSALRLVKAMHFAKTNAGQSARAFAERQPWADRRDIIDTLSKAAVGQVDFNDALSSSPISADFSLALRPLTVLDRLGGREVPFHTRMLTGGNAAIGYFVGQGAAIPLSRADLIGEAMTPAKVAALVVCTRETLEDGSAQAESRLTADLLRAAAQALDYALLDPTNSGSGSTPAAITYDATPLTSAGSSLSNIDSDLKRMLNEVADAGSSLLFAKWVMRPKSAIYLSMLRGSGGDLAFPGITAIGGTLAGLPVLVTANMPAGGSPSETSIALIDTDDFIFAQRDASVTLSQQATIEMSNTPSGNTTTPTAMGNSTVSLFQSEAVALKVLRSINWKQRRPTVSILTEVAY